MKKTIALIFTLLGVAIIASAQVDYQKALQAYQQSGGNVAAAQAALGTTEIAPTASDMERTRDYEVVVTQAAPSATLSAPQGDGLVFGRNIFSGGLTFEPNLNIATPDNYMLGPGDEVIIDVWGDAEVNYTRTISPEGTINIPRVGPVTLSGYTVKEANSRIKRSLARIYAGINSGSTSVKLTPGKYLMMGLHLK